MDGVALTMVAKELEWVEGFVRRRERGMRALVLTHNIH